VPPWEIGPNIGSPQIHQPAQIAGRQGRSSIQ